MYKGKCTFKRFEILKMFNPMLLVFLFKMKPRHQIVTVILEKQKQDQE